MLTIRDVGYGVAGAGMGGLVLREGFPGKVILVLRPKT